MEKRWKNMGIVVAAMVIVAVAYVLLPQPAAGGEESNGASVTISLEGFDPIVMENIDQYFLNLEIYDESGGPVDVSPILFYDAQGKPEEIYLGKTPGEIPYGTYALKSHIEGYEPMEDTFTLDGVE